MDTPKGLRTLCTLLADVTEHVFNHSSHLGVQGLCKSPTIVERLQYATARLCRPRSKFGLSENPAL